MISNELKDIIESLKKQGQMDFIAAATEEQLSDFEEKHDFSFPSK